MHLKIGRGLFFCVVTAFYGLGVRLSHAAPESFDCVIEPQTTVKLASPVEGIIGEVLVDRGDVVKKGQIVARLESDLEEANVALARARAQNDVPIISAKLRAEFLYRKRGRSDQLKDKAIVSAASADEVETDAKVAAHQIREAQINLEISQLELRRSQVQLSQRSIKSTVDGVVTERNLVPGEYRSVQSHVVTIAQLNPLRVETFIPSSLFGKIELGSRAEIIPEEPLSSPRHAVVSVVDRVLDASSGTFGVRLTLANPGMDLPGGLKCKVRFSVSTAQAASK